MAARLVSVVALALLLAASPALAAPERVGVHEVELRGHLVVTDGAYALQDIAPAEAAVSVAGDAAGGAVSLQFALPADSKLHAVRITTAPDAFGPVLRPGQIVVDINDRFGVAVKAADLAEIGEGLGPFYNVTPAAGGFLFQFLILGEGNTTLNLTRDVTAARLARDPRVENITPGELMLYTETNEFAFVSLELVSGAHHQEHRTSVPAIYQTFPVQGLRANSSYHYWLNGTDVAGNTAPLGQGEFRTLPEPVRPAPAVLSISPGRGAVLTTAPSEIVVEFESPLAPVMLDRVRLFVDKREVEREHFEVNETHLRYVPATPLGPGPHSVSVELENMLQGKTTERWTFTVEGKGTPGPSVLVILGLLGIVGVLLRRR